MYLAGSTATPEGILLFVALLLVIAIICIGFMRRGGGPG